jgi:hypothetical protein
MILKIILKVMVEWMALLLYIWEVLGSDLAQRLAFLTEDFHGFFSPLASARRIL